MYLDHYRNMSKSDKDVHKLFHDSVKQVPVKTSSDGTAQKKKKATTEYKTCKKCGNTKVPRQCKNLVIHINKCSEYHGTKFNPNSGNYINETVEKNKPSQSNILLIYINTNLRFNGIYSVVKKLFHSGSNGMEYSAFRDGMEFHGITDYTIHQ